MDPANEIPELTPYFETLRKELEKFLQFLRS